MDIPLNVSVHCTDGRCGRSTHIILNPATEQVTHIVVKERQPSRVERLVPINWIENTAAEVILLNRTKSDFEKLDSFRQTEFIYTEIPLHATDPKLTALWPYVTPVKKIIDESVQHVPHGELAVRKGASVRGTDGRVGRVDEFIIDPDSGDISHLVMREGHLWGQSDVCIPISHIESIDEDVVQLNLDKRTIEKMPRVAIKRRWR